MIICSICFGIILQNEKCIYLYLRWEGTFISMQPYVGQGAEKYLLASKQAPIVGYTKLPPPPKTAEEKSNTVQVISHRLTKLHRS